MPNLHLLPLVRTPEVTYGNNPSIMFIHIFQIEDNITYAKVPTWDGNKKWF